LKYGICILPLGGWWGYHVITGARLPKLEVKMIKRREMKNKRSGIGMSLVASAMNDIQRANKIKSEYHAPMGGMQKVGAMLQSLDVHMRFNNFLALN
jgi:hypothetical protein